MTGNNVVSSYFAHHGTKGMKWGVRHDPGHEGETAKTKKIARLDKRFERNAGTLGTAIALHNAAAAATNKNHIDRINNKPEYKNADFTRDTPLRKQYYAEHQKAFLDELHSAADKMGTNASGTKKYRIHESESGSWEVFVDHVKHADSPEMIVVPTYVKGRITNLKVTEPAVVHGDIVSSYFAHHGVKGMKWGVRRDRSADSGPADVVVKTTPGRRVQTSGGQHHPASEDAKSAAVARQKARASTTDALSTKDLQNLVKRMQLEQQYSQIMAQRNQSVLAKGGRFVKDLLGVGRTANEVISFNNSAAGKLLKEQMRK